MTPDQLQDPIPRVTGTLRAKAIHLPEVIRRGKGMMVLGRRIKSLIYSTDIAIIRNCDADAVFAVYPFTPQQVISQAIISASDMPVFVGVGGGTTKGVRSAIIAQDAEAQGAFGVVVNSPMSNANLRLIKRIIDIPVVVTVVDGEEDIQARIDAGASIVNVAAGKQTAEVVRSIRERFPKLPIMASGGRTDESILETIEAGANSVVYTPPSSSQMFSSVMEQYREEKTKNAEINLRTLDTKSDEISEFFKLFRQ